MATSLSQTIPEIRRANVFRMLNDLVALRNVTVLTVEVTRTIEDAGLDVYVRWLDSNQLNVVGKNAVSARVKSAKFHFSEPIDDAEMIDTIAVGIRMDR